MPNESKTVVIENAQLIFRNFSGEEGTYNKFGDRNFAIILDPSNAEVMAKDGWNIKQLKSQDEGEPGAPYIQVTVKYKVKPPKITMITETSRTRLDEDTVGILDWADIRLCDLVIRGYEWDVNGKQGIKAYLQTMFVTIEEDELERKYSQMFANEDAHE